MLAGKAGKDTGPPYVGLQASYKSPSTPSQIREPPRHPATQRGVLGQTATLLFARPPDPPAVSPKAPGKPPAKKFPVFAARSGGCDVARSGQSLSVRGSLLLTLEVLKPYALCPRESKLSDVLQPVT